MVINALLQVISMHPQLSRIAATLLLSLLPGWAAQGQTVVGPDEVFPITSSTADNFILNGGTLAPRDVILTGEIELQADSKIIRPQNPLVVGGRGGLFEPSVGPTNLDGPITGAGGLEIGNESRDQLFLSGNNSYLGETLITSGDIFASSPTAFGSSAAGTIVRSGNLFVQSANEEQFRVESGRLYFQAGDFIPRGPLTIAGGETYLPQLNAYTLPVIVDAAPATAGGTLSFGFDDTATWTGGTTGTGNLKLVGRLSVDAPLTHDGDLIIDGVKLNAVNTYTGRTIFTANNVIDRADVFGTSTTPIEINEAEVTVEVLPANNRGFHVRRGTLNVQTAEPINAGIILGGDFSAEIRGNGTFNGPIDYVSAPGGGNASLWSGVFNGPIRGETDLLLGGQGTVVLNAANEIRGRVRTRGGGITVNHEDALVLPATQIESGTLRLNVPATSSPFMTGPVFSGDDGVLQLNVDQQIEETWTNYTGTIRANAEISFQRLRLLGINGLSRLDSTGNGSSEIRGELLAYGTSQLAGKVIGDGKIRAVANENGGALDVRGDLTEFTGTLHADTGLLSLGQSSDSNPDVELNPEIDIHVGPLGSLAFRGYNIVIENDIFLNNSHGPSRFTGALTYRGNGRSQELAGRIDVGDQGSTIVGGFEVTGTLTGTNLTHRPGRGVLGIRSPQHELRGTLNLVDEGGVIIYDSGEFHGLDQITLRTGGVISLQPSTNTDRIDDATPIHSYGGFLQLNSSRNQPTSEFIGELSLHSGRTEVFASSDHGGQQATLVIDQLTRERGAILHFDDAGRVTSTQINDIATFDGNMIGGWAVTDQEFASIDENGFVGTLRPTSSNLATATPQDHVRVVDNQSIAQDLAIASLQHDPAGSAYALDLNGNRLTVRSGGVRRSGTIENGSITAGDGQPAELFFHDTGVITADIVDNGEDGAVSLVMARTDFRMRLSGNNSYTGGTFIHGNGQFINGDGTLTIDSIAAIPANDRVFIDGGRYELELPPDAGTVFLDQLHLRSNGLVAGRLTPIDAQEIYLEHGRVSAEFVGDGTIYKDTPQTVSFENVESPNFTGQVIVREGTLSLEPAELAQATYQIDGGRVDFSGNRNGVLNEIHLNGGALHGGRLVGDVFVDSDSTLIGEGFATNIRGRLVGDADLTIDGRLDDYFDGYVGIFGDASEFHGDFHVRSGPLRIGSPATLGDGAINVAEGGRLILASDQETSPATEVDNTINLHGGTLISAPPRRSFRGVAPPSFATGDVHVHSEAFIGSTWHGNIAGSLVPGLTFAGRLILEDKANVYGLSDSRAQFHGGENPLIEISGELLVGENTTWSMATASLLISGSIKPTATQSSIDFQGVPSSLVLRDAEFMTMAGKSLAVTVNGAATSLALQGNAATISGDGNLLADLELSNGATISPGNSPGQLTIVGDTIVGEGAIYEWEIASTTGPAGTTWDLLEIRGHLSFTATENAPWIIQVSDLPGFSPEIFEPLLIATAESISGFDAAAVQFDLTGITDAWPELVAENLFLFSNNGNLFLQAVPEPTSSFLAMITILLAINLPAARCLVCSRRLKQSQSCF